MNQAQKKTLLTGCGIGCAVVIVLAIVIAGVGFGLTVRLMHSSAPKLARMVADDYAEFKATNRVPNPFRNGHGPVRRGCFRRGG